MEYALLRVCTNKSTPQTCIELYSMFLYINYKCIGIFGIINDFVGYSCIYLFKKQKQSCNVAYVVILLCGIHSGKWQNMAFCLSELG